MIEVTGGGGHIRVADIHVYIDIHRVAKAYCKVQGTGRFIDRYIVDRERGGIVVAGNRARTRVGQVHAARAHRGTGINSQAGRKGLIKLHDGVVADRHRRCLAGRAARRKTDRVRGRIIVRATARGCPIGVDHVDIHRDIQNCVQRNGKINRAGRLVHRDIVDRERGGIVVAGNRARTRVGQVHAARAHRGTGINSQAGRKGLIKLHDGVVADRHRRCLAGRAARRKTDRVRGRIIVRAAARGCPIGVDHVDIHRDIQNCVQRNGKINRAGRLVHRYIVDRERGGIVILDRARIARPGRNITSIGRHRRNNTQGHRERLVYFHNIISVHHNRGCLGLKVGARKRQRTGQATGKITRSRAPIGRRIRNIKTVLYTSGQGSDKIIIGRTAPGALRLRYRRYRQRRRIVILDRARIARPGRNITRIRTHRVHRTQGHRESLVRLNHIIALNRDRHVLGLTTGARKRR